MLARLGRFTYRRRRAVLIGSLLFVLASFGVAGGVAGRLTTGGFADPNSESERAASILEHQFHAKDANLVLLVTVKGGATVDDPAVAAAGRQLTDELAATRHLQQVASYWSLQNAPPLKSRGGHQALVLGVISGSDSQVADRIGAISEHFTRDGAAVRVAVGGRAEVNRQVNDQIQSDLPRAEGIAFPITLILLVIVFGSLVAAGLPLLVGVVAIAGSFLALYAISSITEVSVYSLNLTTAMGLGLAIDYSLFIVSRYREELRNGSGVEDAVVRTVQTAGRTVLGSALTVAVALGALLLFPLSFLRSFAYAGIAVSLLAAAGAVVALPALLSALGHRVDSLRIFRHREPKPVGEGVWHRIAMLVMRRPIPIATAVIALLVILGLPFFNILFGLPDDRVLPAQVSSRQVQNDIRSNFTSNEAAALQIAVPGLAAPQAHTGAIAGYAAALSKLQGVARVDAVTGSYARGQALPVEPAVLQRFRSDRGTWLSVVPSVEPLSSAGEHLTHEVRDLASPVGRTLVTGPSAQLVDSKDSLFGRMPLAALWIAVATFVLLFLMFGSVIVPIKALVLNVLSLTATFGAMVWIFQEGHFASLLGFTPTGSLAATMPILMFCVAFGLSMDYEVFLLSRIKEEHDRTHDNTASVAIGLERTGRIVTAAAVLISVVFIAFSTSGVSFIKLFGIGLALAVLMDAFVIRATLVPAFMRLAGEFNWWAPRPMRRFYERFGIAEHSEPVTGGAPARGEQAAEPVGVS